VNIELPLKEEDGFLHKCDQYSFSDVLRKIWDFCLQFFKLPGCITNRR